MTVKRCPNGHYYNEEKFQECPHCSEHSSFMNTNSYSERLLESRGEKIGFKTVTSEKARQHLIGHKMNQPEADNDEKTIGIMSELGTGSAAAGWLVCTEGALRGRDFTIKCGKNVLSEYPGLEKIPYGTEIVYDNVHNIFVMYAGGDGVQVNDKPVSGGVKLEKSDAIRINGMKLVFIPFCEGDFKW